MRCVLFFFLCVLCVWIYNKWKSAQRRCTHCALAVVRCSKKFCHTAHPFQGVQNGQNLISWRWSLPLPTNPVWWRLMHTISSYRGNRPTNTHTNTQTGLITIHCTAALLACSVIITWQQNVKSLCILLQQNMMGGRDGDSQNDWLNAHFLQARCPSYHPTNTFKVLNARGGHTDT